MSVNMHLMAVFIYTIHTKICRQATSRLSKCARMFSIHHLAFYFILFFYFMLKFI